MWWTKLWDSREMQIPFYIVSIQEQSIHYSNGCSSFFGCFRSAKPNHWTGVAAMLSSSYAAPQLGPDYHRTPCCVLHAIRHSRASSWISSIGRRLPSQQYPRYRPYQLPLPLPDEFCCWPVQQAWVVHEGKRPCRTCIPRQRRPPSVAPARANLWILAGTIHRSYPEWAIRTDSSAGLFLPIQTVAAWWWKVGSFNLMDASDCQIYTIW